jgi:KDO2-lipid IV(A) lauroyltransferase
MMKVLKDKGTLIVLFDRPVDIGRGVPVRFFGRQTAVPGGPAVLAKRTGALVVPVYMFRHADSSFESMLFPPITVPDTGDKDRDTQVVMQKLMDTMQSVVRERPDQWYMFRSMWPADRAEQPSGRGAANEGAARG